MSSSTSNRDEVKAFLSSRRAKVTPAQVGLPPGLRARRVPGLRRSEVADLAGVSVEYYSQLERGDLHGASREVLDALARALVLDEAEHDHLRRLADTAQDTTRRHRPRAPAEVQVRPELQRLVDRMTAVPAIINDARIDTVAANALARALYAPVLATATGRRPANQARFLFLDPRAKDFWVDWNQVADDTVASLRTAAGRDPHDSALAGLVGELTVRSEEFSARWNRHDVRRHRTGIKQFRHPVVGELTLGYEALELAADPGLTLIAFTADVGSPADDALTLLASWAATDHDTTPTGNAEQTTTPS